MRRWTKAGLLLLVIVEGVCGSAAEAMKRLPRAPRLIHPSGVAIDMRNRIYVSDIGSHSVYRIDGPDKLTVIAGARSSGFSGDGGPAKSARLAAPHAIAFDAAGDLLIADTWNHRLRRIDARGVITTIAGTGKEGYDGDGGPAIHASLNSPQGVAVDRDGSILVSDTYNHVVRRIGKDGVIATIAGAKPPGYGGDGAAALKAPLNLPTAARPGPDGYIYLSDSANSRVRRIDPSGTITNFVGFGPAAEIFGAGFVGDGGPPEKAQIFTASDLAFDNAGNLYISDTGNNRIRVVGGGRIRTLAGTGEPGLSGDHGPALQAKLHAPQKLTVDGRGNVIFADRVNGRVRSISPAGVISTVAGNGTGGMLLLSAE